MTIDEDLAFRLGVFEDREHAGQTLARMLRERAVGEVTVVAIPAGGVPVAVPICLALTAPLRLAVVSKMTLPWTTEAGFGALAFDGSIELNRSLIIEVGLTDEQIQAGIAVTGEKVRGRVQSYGKLAQLGDLAGAVVVVDDGLASGFTMRVAIRALRELDTTAVTVAVPTAHVDALRTLAGEVDEILCPNPRGPGRFAVADAYRHWHDVDDAEQARAIARLRPSAPSA